MEQKVMTVTVKEAARLLGVSLRSAYVLANNGSIPVLRLGRRLVVPRAALERLLGGHQTGLVDGNAAEAPERRVSGPQPTTPSASTDPPRNRR
jgi:excisionase family DNA binding protein